MFLLFSSNRYVRVSGFCPVFDYFFNVRKIIILPVYALPFPQLLPYMCSYLNGGYLPAVH